MKKSKIVKIVLTIIWTVIGIRMMFALEKEAYHGWEDGDYVLRLEPIYWHDNLWIFFIFMIPVIGMWIYTLITKEATQNKPVKRRSRLV